MTAIAPNPLLDAALAYAAAGLRVFPLHNTTPGGCSCMAGPSPACTAAKPSTHGKHPRTASGLKDATADAKQIRKWWRAWPAANVGVGTGPESGVWVLGPDGEQGIADLAALALEHGGLPETTTSRTGGGGRHHFFRWPADGKVTNRANHRGTKVDVRGAGGYVVAPPSASGSGAYEWVDERGPADAPAWLLAWCRSAQPKPAAKAASVPPAPSADAGRRPDVHERARLYLSRMPPAVSGQGGHSAAMDAARAVVYGFDLGPEAGYDLLAAEYNPRCLPPWSEAELRHKCADADSKPFDKARGYLLSAARPEPATSAARTAAPPPRPQPPPPPVAPYAAFPTEALPGVLRRYAEGVAGSLKCDPSYAALPALSLAAAAVGAAVAVRPKRGFVEPAALWTVVVGASGTAKSPAARPTIDAALDIEQRLREAYATAKAAERGRGDDDDTGDKAEPPPAREYFAVSDITVEKLTANFQTSPRGLFVHRDELAGWFNALTRHSKGGGESDAPQWLSLYDGGSLSYQRRTGEPREVFVRNAVASIAGGIQPAVLRRCLSDDTFITNGMASRFLFAMPPEAYVGWTDDELDADADAAFKAAVAALRALPFDPKRRAAVGLTSEALAGFKRFMDGCKGHAEGQADGPMKACWPKMPRHALRLALVHHCVTAAEIGADPARHAVDDLSMSAGVTLAGWFAREAERVYAMLAETEADRTRRHLTDWIARRGGTAVPRDLINLNRAKYPNAELAEAALEALAAAGLGAWLARPAGPKGGRPTAVFALAGLPAEPPAG